MLASTGRKRRRRTSSKRTSPA
uniref:Uncharacterized protein n=1 Tax=Arundo donax TaxID=35708 RepID=A0A0A8Z1E5_ARUDO